jgi:hypothetical protein
MTSEELPGQRPSGLLLRGMIRVALGVLGAYWLSSEASVVIAAALQQLGLAASEAVLIGAMLAFLIYPLAALWVFVAQRLWPVALLLLGGSVALTLLSLLHGKG